jgi:LacI family transcriptional regulator
MLAGGRHDLVLLNGPQRVSACRLRSAGFWKGVKEAGQAVRSAREVQVPFDTSAAAATARTVLAEAPAPTGIVCGSDTIAAGVLDAARALGLSVPDDVAVSGFDDRSFAAHTAPSLTTVRMPLHDIGHTAARMLFSMIGDMPVMSRRVILPTEIILRESTPAG